ncbi:MAG: hypothetical protein BZY79_03915 [SAR202 cluster bacterium Casp-Chloro-G4]|nr:MAG: hypothetical protein BZY79_03915 [SAR202 cluster bacterium Casp-Chloro-G4]
MGKTIVVLLVGVIAVFVFVPGVRQTFTRMLSNSETVVVPANSGTASAGNFSPSTSGQDTLAGQELEIVTLLGYDAIPAILDPQFLDAKQAQTQFQPNEQVLGLSINGENRAYSIPMLSRHEIVNDVVGGVPVAVTW